MGNNAERTLGHLFGLVGGLLIGLGGLVALVSGLANLALDHLTAAAGSLSAAIVLWVVGGLVIVFSHFGEHAWQDRPSSTGVLLIVLAVVGWAGLGVGSNLVALLGGLLTLVGGILYLIEPMRRGTSALLAPA